MPDQVLQKYEDSHRGREKFEGRDQYVLCKAHADLTALTPYKLICDEGGPITAALASDTLNYRVVVPKEAVSSGEEFYGKVRGDVDDMVVPSSNHSIGYGLKVVAGAVATSGADFSGLANEFAVARAAGTGVTAIDVYLVGREITATTS